MKSSFTKVNHLARSFLSIILILWIVSGHYVFGQNETDPIVDLITIDESLVNVFKQLEQQTGLAFTYSENVINDKQTYTFNLRKVSFQKVLEAIATQSGLNFKRIGNSISVSKTNISPAKIEESQPIYRKISGIVKDSVTGENIPGAPIKAVDHSIGTVTDINGQFILQLPASVKALSVSFLGYKSKTLSLSPTTDVYTISLNPEILKETVVIGYQETEKELLSSSIAKVDNKVLENQPVLGFDEAIVGKIAGVQVSQSSGAPGSAMTIRIRGTNSITSGNEPLYVVDGIPISDGVRNAGGTLESYADVPMNPLNSININDIASIEILKDAAAAAIYGSRGANGVVLITTKQGKKGKVKFQYNAYTGWQQVTKKIEMMDAYEYAQLKFDGHNNAYLDYLTENGLSGSSNDPNTLREANGAGTGDFKIPTEIIPYVNGIPGLTNTDWQDEIFRTGKITSHTLSASGGNQQVNYYLSGTYLKQEGILISSGYEQISARMNLKVDQGKWRFGGSFAPSRGLHDRVKSEGPYWADGVIGTALVSSPMFPVYENGEFAYGQHLWRGDKGESWTDSYINPVALAELLQNNITHLRLLSSTFAEFEPIKDLVIKTSLGTDINDFTRDYYRPKSLPVRNLAISETPGSGKSRRETFFNWVWENTVTYQKTLAQDHDLSLLSGMTLQKEQQNENYINVQSYPNDLVTTTNAATTINNAGSQATAWSLMSYLGRAQYAFKGKYLAAVAVRFDGSSRFGQDQRWGTFPSASLGWVISEEPFMRNFPTVSFLKLRSSYGVTGNFNIGNNEWLSTLNGQNYVLGGDAEVLVEGIAPSNLGNQDLRWEKTTTMDIGAEVGLLRGMLNIEVDYYQSHTTDLLLDVPVPQITGFGTGIQNIGEVRNRGFELSAQFKKQIGKFNINFGGNFATNENRVMGLGVDEAPIIQRGGSEGTLYITTIGHSIGSFYTYVRDGVFTSEEELENYPHAEGTYVGDAKILDLNQDGVINDNDRAITGSYFPDFTFGLNAGASFKGFDFAIQLQGAQGNEVLNLMRRYIYNMEGHQNNVKAANNRYRSPQDIGDGQTPRADKAAGGNNSLISDWMIEDGSFTRIRTITIGYTLPTRWTEKAKISHLRVYFSAQNPFTFTDYSGYNPEVSGNYNNSTALVLGEDYGTYPLAKTYSTGINLTF